MATKHNQMALRFGDIISKLEEKAKKETNRELIKSYKRQIADIITFLDGPLIKDQENAAAAKRDKSVEKASSLKELKEIDGEHNLPEGSALNLKLGGNIPQHGNESELPQHGLFGNIGNTASNATQNPAGTIAGGAVGGGVGTGLGSVVGGTLGTLVGGPIGTAAGTALGASIGGTVGTGLGAGYGANGQFPWQNNDNSMTPGALPPPGGDQQQNLPPPPPFAPPMNGPGAGYKPVHDAYYANGGEIPRYNYGSALAGIGQAAGYGNMAGGLLGLPENEFNESKLWNTGKNVAGLIPAAAPYAAIENAGSNLIGLPEFFDPAGSLFGSFKKDPETGERDWSKIAANLFGGSIGGFLWNQMNEPEKRGGVAGWLTGNRKEYGGNLSRHQYDPNVGYTTFSQFNNSSGLQMPTSNWQSEPTIAEEPPVEPPNDNGWAGPGDWINEFPWQQAGGVANDYVTNQQIQAPLRENAMQLQGPRGYIWNPFYNSEESNMINMENDMRSNYDEMYDLAREEEYYSPSRALDQNRFNTDRAIKASEDLVGIDKLLYQDRTNAAGMDRDTDIIGDFTDLNKQANSPGADLAKIQSTVPYLDALYAKTAGRGAARTMADMQAFDWNSRVDKATQDVRNELAQGTATYAQGNRNNQYMGDALSMGGAYWGFQPGVGMTWKQGGQGQGADPYGMTYEDFQEWQEWQNSQEETT